MGFLSNFFGKKTESGDSKGISTAEFDQLAEPVLYGIQRFKDAVARCNNNRMGLTPPQVLRAIALQTPPSWFSPDSKIEELDTLLGLKGRLTKQIESIHSCVEKWTGKAMDTETNGYTDGFRRLTKEIERGEKLLRDLRRKCVKNKHQKVNEPTTNTSVSAPAVKPLRVTPRDSESDVRQSEGYSPTSQQVVGGEEQPNKVEIQEKQPQSPDIEYFEAPRPVGDGICSDSSCPCGDPGITIPRGTGCLYIPQDVVDFRCDARSILEAQEKVNQLDKQTGSSVLVPILMCEQGARKRCLELEVAKADARHWWETGLVPLRPTPLQPVRKCKPKPLPLQKMLLFGGGAIAVIVLVVLVIISVSKNVGGGLGLQSTQPKFGHWEGRTDNGRWGIAFDYDAGGKISNIGIEKLNSFNDPCSFQITEIPFSTDYSFDQDISYADLASAVGIQGAISGKLDNASTASGKLTVTMCGRSIFFYEEDLLWTAKWIQSQDSIAMPISTTAPTLALEKTATPLPTSAPDISLAGTYCQDQSLIALVADKSVCEGHGGFLCFLYSDGRCVDMPPGDDNATAPLATSTATHIIPTNESTHTPPTAMLSEFLNDVQIITIDQFNDTANWIIWDPKSTTLSNGIVEVNGKPDWTNAIAQSKKLSEGMGIVIEFKNTTGNEYEFNIDTGTWNTDGYKGFAVSRDSSPKVWLWEGKNLLTGNDFHGNLPLTKDKWYCAAISIGQNGEFLAVVWDLNDPSRRAVYREKMNETWSGKIWEFRAQLNIGTSLSVDNFSIFSFSTLK